MYTTKKRDKTSELIGILRKESKKSNSTRRVGFVDDIGKPLVEYRNLPPREILGLPGIPSGSNHHEKASGHFISTHENRSKVNQTSWKVFPVKNAMTPKTGCLQMRMIEEKRLESENISRAPLFGTFDAFEPPHLVLEAIIRAREPVPMIPIGSSTTIIDQTEDQPFQSTQNIYQQTFDNPVTEATRNVMEVQQVNGSVFNLMAQLKQRGLIPGEQLASSSDNTFPMQQQQMVAKRVSRWSQPTWKPNKLCTFYINKPNGCNRGDSCKFEHNDIERERRQQELQNQKPNNDSWRPRHPVRQSRVSTGISGERRNVDRSRSP